MIIIARDGCHAVKMAPTPLRRRLERFLDEKDDATSRKAVCSSKMTARNAAEENISLQITPQNTTTTELTY